ncbi:hypothetical protein FB451DRAFT_1410483 [Mycena latifolia]|nr:hypothetical protein FB451DRAFT_1410483 [Mycena latifolia]
MERLPKAIFDNALNTIPEDAPLPSLDATSATEDALGAIPAYETTAVKLIICMKNDMNDFKAMQHTFLKCILSMYHYPLLLTPCACGAERRVRKVGCSDCVQAELLCPQCWLNKHRTMPTHWALVWKADEQFFEKRDFSRVMKNAVIVLGHNGHRCPEADLGRSFTLVDSNGIHATALSFCRCKTPDAERGPPEWEQLLRAGIFPGSVKDPKTAYTMNLLEYYHQQRNQGKGSAYGFVLVLQRMANPFFVGSVPDIYTNFLTVTQFHQDLDIIMRRGHLISQHFTLDGNFKANLFFKRDNDSDTCLMDGRMHFPKQMEYEELAKLFVVSEADKEVPCKTHIGSIRLQGQVKYGNTAVSGVVGCACDHAVLGSFIDMLKGEAFTLGTYAQREQLKRTNSLPHGPESMTPTVFSYDSYCSFVVNMVPRAIALFPKETWLHEAASAEGQIPADHINGHGLDCQMTWQAVYFACRSHFHGETAEMIWAFLNMANDWSCAPRHYELHRCMEYLEAELLATERLDTLRLFELHMAVVEDLSWQHASEVGGTLQSVYQHASTRVLTIDNMLASLITEEQNRSTCEEQQQARGSVAEWIHDGMGIECQEVLIIALLECHREHPMQETWETITKLRDTLNLDLKKFRECQLAIYPRLTLSVLDMDEPELTAVQLPSYCMKHGQWVAMDDEHSKLREAEIQLRCGEANSGILAAGITCLQRNLQKAELMKTFEITMYNRGRSALIHLGHMAKDAVEPYPPLTHRDTRRKDTHLHLASTLSPFVTMDDSADDEPQLLVGTQTLKHSGFTKSQRTPKRLKDITPDDVVVESSSASEAEDSDLEMSPSTKGARANGSRRGKKKGKKSDGWIWLEGMTRGQTLGDEKLAEYKMESDRVQWFRTEAEMYRWLEQYKRKHVELMRVIERFRCDGMVWVGLADWEEERSGGRNGAVTFAHMQAAMYKRLEHNARVVFKGAESGAHRDWVSAMTFDELVTKIDGWRDAVFKWMDDMGIHRAYKDF